jgi:hypothetical protein
MEMELAEYGWLDSHKDNFTAIAISHVCKQQASDYNM